MGSKFLIGNFILEFLTIEEFIQRAFLVIRNDGIHHAIAENTKLVRSRRFWNL